MTTYERDTKTLELPWPFTGREEELELVRRSLAGGRQGMVVTGPAGRGKTRLVTEAVRGTDCARVAGTPETRGLPFAAFAHLLPETESLHRAVQLLSSVRLLLVDDAHLLDDVSAALVHQLAVHGRTRLLVVATDGARVPGAISRLWTGELLPRLALEPLPREETARLLAAGAGGPEALTVNRLYRLCRGDLRLLRELVDAVRERGPLHRVADSAEWAWRGPVPITATVRERAAHLLDRAGPGERETLDRLAFGEPFPMDVDTLDLDALEALETDGLVHVDEQGAARLAHPLHGPVLRAAAGRLRARRLARTPESCAAALETETATLTRAIAETDVRAVPAPVGEWLVDEGSGIPARHAALRARFARLRGALREAAAWAAEGLRTTPDDPACHLELGLAAAQSGDPEHAMSPSGPGSDGSVRLSAPGPSSFPGRSTTESPHVAEGSAATWWAAARGDLDAALATVGEEPYDAVRLGAPDRAVGLLTGVFAAHAEALAHGDGPALDRAAQALEERGFLLFAAEAYAQAVGAHRDPGAARTSRTRAVALARRCQGARTPALSGLVLGELTARQRQIVTLAAAGLSNRQIAEKLTLSIRTVGNHLYSAYARLGASDRDALPCLVELPEAQPA
ncbi:LuxR family transcriptional regulator [Streptomyces sp. CC0208]|uniref:LuxR family transcriptional regulator AbsR2 n=1 Tax=Streptomyces sp. CC0208 TaxID=2306165 RepID=UPI0013C40AF4|nr:LuxR family transcriptional regulator [Streptomyces sp. CC0208]